MNCWIISQYEISRKKYLSNFLYTRLLQKHLPSFTSRFIRYFFHCLYIWLLTWTLETFWKVGIFLRTTGITTSTALFLWTEILIFQWIALQFNTQLLLELFHLSYKGTVRISYSSYSSNKSNRLFICPSFAMHEINNESSHWPWNTLIRMD